MGTLWNQSNQLVFTNDGIIAPGAKAYFFVSGTSTPKTVYQDGNESTARTHPVVADGNGRWPAVFVPFGAFKVQITTSGGSAIGDTIDNIPNEAPTDPTDSVDANSIFQTGDMIFVGSNTTRAGFVRCNGRTIGSAASSATERANADTADLYAFIWNGYANGQAAVSGGRGASAAADFAANKTIAMPDFRGASLVGFDDMGNTAASLLGSAPVVSGSGILAGSILGANTHLITVANLPSHQHGLLVTTSPGTAHSHGLVAATVTGGGEHEHSGNTGDGGVDHNHAYTSSTANRTIGYQAGGSSDTAADDTSAGQITNNASAYLHTHPFSIGSSGTHGHDVGGTTDPEFSHTHTVTGPTAFEGGNTAHNLLSRAVPVTVLMKL